MPEEWKALILGHVGVYNRKTLLSQKHKIWITCLHCRMDDECRRINSVTSANANDVLQLSPNLCLVLHSSFVTTKERKRVFHFRVSRSFPIDV